MDLLRIIVPITPTFQEGRSPRAHLECINICICCQSKAHVCWDNVKLTTGHFNHPPITFRLLLAQCQVCTYRSVTYLQLLFNLHRENAPPQWSKDQLSPVVRLWCPQYLGVKGLPCFYGATLLPSCLLLFVVCKFHKHFCEHNLEVVFTH